MRLLSLISLTLSVILQPRWVTHSLKFVMWLFLIAATMKFLINLKRLIISEVEGMRGVFWSKDGTYDYNDYI